MTDSAQVAAALDAVERAELPSLMWGLVDQTLSEDRVLDAIASADGSSTPDALMAELLRRGLIFDVPRTSPPRYRSRMAEGIRLFSQLRQLFPDRAWEQGARLVADYRLLVRPRHFPRRDTPLAAARDELQTLGIADSALDAFTALLGDASKAGSRQLARFQLDATREILEALQRDKDQAVIVSAGTGSGKTLAFYLPTLMHLAADAQLGKGTAVLALYPRNELLKDQLQATLREVRRLRFFHPKKPPLRVGVWFGPTPFGWPGNRFFKDSEWRKFTGGHICPFLKCPGDPAGEECGGDLRWSFEDQNKGNAKLGCLECGLELTDDEFAFTRKGMQQQPPDILFTTTESLNRLVSNNWARHVVGVGAEANRRLRMVLVDEAHTYEGSSGAQTAYLLRRFRHLIDSPLLWVGLSATLRNADTYFASLVRVDPASVLEISPHSDALQRGGHEYQLVLRGDPASQAALLSTTIQSLMLLLRLQDPPGETVSEGLFGNKVFAFCDNLDLVNRLFRQLLDAEGRRPNTETDSEKQGSLALLRSEVHHRGVDDWDTRDAAGQNWWVVDRLRESRVPPVIDRTSSQHSGVKDSAELVVATASLEVGYDDPGVGGVLQHKAPRDAAGFLQRRGRAGRPQAMRPWTVVVLSDYGRDRLTYQRYEELLDPELPPKSLPLANRSIRRMQASFAMMDWLAHRLSDGHWRSTKGQLFKDLEGPPEKKGRQADDVHKRQQEQALLLEAVVSDHDGRRERNELREWLVSALALPEAEVDVLLWEGPRAVLTELIPTTVRRLRSGWGLARDGRFVDNADRFRRGHPLPEFVPQQLFGDLMLPEVHIDAPEDYDDAADTAEGVMRVLSELAPGNVTMRYAVWKTRGLWIDPRHLEDGFLDISESLGTNAASLGPAPFDGEMIDVIRPFTVSPDVAIDVASTSKGQFDWLVEFRAKGGGEGIKPPPLTAWSDLIAEGEIFLHAADSGLSVLRYAATGLRETVSRGARDRERYRIKNNGTPVAVGADFDVDGLRVRVNLPQDLAEFDLEGDGRRLRHLRRARFLGCVSQQLLALDADDPTVDVNPFLADWIGELALAAIAGAPGIASVSEWSAADWKEGVLAAFDAAFSGLHVDDGDEPRLRVRLGDEVAKMAVVEVLVAAFDEIQKPPDEQWLEWLQQRYLATITGAVQAAVQTILPNFDIESDLAADIGATDLSWCDLWFTETVVGGGGVIEAFREAYLEDPRRFWRLVQAALGADDPERVAEYLPQFVDEITEGHLQESAARLRSSLDSDDATAAWKEFLAEAAERGFPATRSFAVALGTRVFRSGSSPLTDEALQVAGQRWGSLEESLGFALDHRTACAVLANDEVVVQAFAKARSSNLADGNEWVFSALLDRLWAAPEELRTAALRPTGWFGPGWAASERTLVLDLLPDHSSRVDVAGPDWRAEFDAALTRDGRCVLVGDSTDDSLLASRMLEAATEPIELGVLHLYPRLVGISRTHRWTEAEFEMVEAPQ